MQPGRSTPSGPTTQKFQSLSASRSTPLWISSFAIGSRNNTSGRSASFFVVGKYWAVTHRSASSDHIARIYNHSMHAALPFLPALTAEIVLDAFFLHALLKSAHRQQNALCVPHNGPQSQRFEAAMRARNKYMSGTGQEHWAHACDTCTKFKQDEAGRQCELITAISTAGSQMRQTDSLLALWTASASGTRAAHSKMRTACHVDTPWSPLEIITAACICPTSSCAPSVLALRLVRLASELALCQSIVLWKRVFRSPGRP